MRCVVISGGILSGCPDVHTTLSRLLANIRRALWL
jgi:hypothetical protein